MKHPNTGNKLDGVKSVKIVDINVLWPGMWRDTGMTNMDTDLLIIFLFCLPACLAGHAWNYDVKVR